MDHLPVPQSLMRAAWSHRTTSLVHTTEPASAEPYYIFVTNVSKCLQMGNEALDGLLALRFMSRRTGEIVAASQCSLWPERERTFHYRPAHALATISETKKMALTGRSL
jgi:hypothetical protein